MPPKLVNNLPLVLGVLGIVAAVWVGARLRYSDLDVRPMHTDEAVHAIKLIELGEEGWFDYDPAEYHGPTLHYATLILGDSPSRDEVSIGQDAAKLRRTTALYGVAMVLMAALVALGCRMGWGGAVAAAFLGAVSPMWVYYSRYYIMEVPFALFGLGVVLCAWRWMRSGATGWAVGVGVFSGLMHATKETCVFPFAALGIAGIIVCWRSRKFPPRLVPGLGLMAVVAVVVSAFIFSDGLRHWADVGESYKTYLNYLGRAGGAGHEHPPSFYLKLLLAHRSGYWWGEWPITLLALLGTVLAWWQGRVYGAAAFLRWLSIGAGLLLALYLVVPYKTPWTILGAQSFLVLLAAGGVGLLGERLGRPARLGGTFAVAVAAWVLYVQAGRANHPYMCADARNPYVYGHTVPDFVRLAGELREAEAAGSSVQVVQREFGWPMPYYMRDRDRVGYRATADAALVGLDPDIMVVDAAQREELEEVFGEGLEQYHRTVRGLRPDTVLLLYTKKREIAEDER